MKRMEQLSLKVLKVAAECLNYKHETMNAIMYLKDETRMTTKLNVFETPEGIILLNISNVKTYMFDDKEEFNKYLLKKFDVFKTDKEMWQTFTGMDDATWEEWNK